MSARVLHLNFLAEQDCIPEPSFQAKALLPILSGAMVVGLIVWTVIIGVRLSVAKSQVSQLRRDIEKCTVQNNESEFIRSQCDDLEAEIAQYDYYRNGIVSYGTLLKRLARAVPAGVSLTSLLVPPPHAQALKPAPGVAAAPLQGPTETFEKRELRLTGLARDEGAVFQLMGNLRKPAFTNDIVIVEEAADPDQKSPRVLAFRQELSKALGTPSGIFFDLVYTLRPREFVK